MSNIHPPYLSVYYSGASFDDRSGDWAVMGEDKASVERITLVEVTEILHKVSKRG